MTGKVRKIYKFGEIDKTVIDNKQMHKEFQEKALHTFLILKLFEMGKFQ